MCVCVCVCVCACRASFRGGGEGEQSFAPMRFTVKLYDMVQFILEIKWLSTTKYDV